MSNRRRVGVVIPIWGRKILMLKRSPDSSNPNKWNFPGGSVEDGESVPEGAARELYEETGLEKNIDNLKFLGHMESGPLDIYFYVGYFNSPEVTINVESSEYKWATLDESDEMENIKGRGVGKNLRKSIERAINSGGRVERA